MPVQRQAIIRDFRAEDATAFRRLNEEWLRRYFRVEPKDVELLGDPVGRIIAPGGAILMLEMDGQAIGCCALIRMEEGRFEVAKMSVTEAQQGRGYGELLLRGCIQRASEMGARRLLIESNSRLGAALGLYRKAGFVDLPRAAAPPTEYERVDVFMELWLEPRPRPM